ncbi:hypothetical protein ABPG75_006907 [Micractinium tetrahymenae]
METIKGAVDSAKKAMLGEEAPPGSTEVTPSGTAHKTAPVQQTGTGVVGSLEEAGHRVQEQQGADNPGWYDAQARLTGAAQRANEKLSER